MKAQILSVGIAAPGLESWQEARQILKREKDFVEGDFKKYRTEKLPPNERRRMTESTRLAFQACEDCLREHPSGGYHTVFASYSNDLANLDRLCRTIIRNPASVSPTAFHNSVANAPAGYWSIATGEESSSTTLCGGAGNVASALLEAMALAEEGNQVLVAAYDVISPGPFYLQRPYDVPFAWSMLLGPNSDPILEPTSGEGIKFGHLSVTTTRDAFHTGSVIRGHEERNQAAEILPLLELIARHTCGHAICPGSGTANWLFEYQPSAIK